MAETDRSASQEPAGAVPPLPGQAPVLGGWWSQLAQERLVSHAVMLTLGSVVAGFLGFGLHSALSHRLSPSAYGSAFAVISLQNLLVLGMSWIGLVVARVMARAVDRPGVTASVLRTGNLLLLGAGALLALLVAVASPLASSALHISMWLLVVGIASLPFLFATPLMLGALQGMQRFGALSGIYVAQASLRLGGAVVLGASWGALGAVGGLSLAALATYLLVLVTMRNQFRPRGQDPGWPGIARYSALIAPSAVAQALLLTTDVVLAKHYFSATVAGEYSVVAVLGRAIYWGALSVAIVLFPKVVLRERSGGSSLPLVLAALGLAIGGGGLAMLAFSLWGQTIITVFAGSAYAGGAGYIGLYSLGMCLLGAATVLLTVHQSRARQHFLGILLSVTALEPLLIVLFHASPQQVVIVLDITMALLLVGMAAAYLIDERTGRVSNPPAASVACGTLP